MSGTPQPRGRKSPQSHANGRVEVARVSDGVVIRDSKEGGSGPELKFTLMEWEAFLAGVRRGEFDLAE